MQSVDLVAGKEEFDIGPVSATAQGAPAPLPGPVVFTPAGDPVVELVPIDAVTVTVRALALGGSATIIIESGGLSDTVLVNVSIPVPVADALVVPLSPIRSF